MDSRGQNPTEAPRDSRNLTFSQANGYEEIPRPLKLEELPNEARTRIWNVFFKYFFYDSYLPFNIEDGENNAPFSIDDEYLYISRFNIVEAVYLDYFILPLDDWDLYESEQKKTELRRYIEKQLFNKVFDLIQFVMRHSECRPDFIGDMKEAFALSRLTYTVDIGPPPTIFPAVTQEEKEALLESLETLREAGLSGAAKHLRKASKCINQGDWAGSVRESIHAVESVARTLAPKTKRLDLVLKTIENDGGFYPALKEAFVKLYSFASDEPGIRHALKDQTEANVGMDEAVFMLGACASFASYLWRKHQANNSA